MITLQFCVPDTSSALPGIAPFSSTQGCAIAKQTGASDLWTTRQMFLCIADFVQETPQKESPKAPVHCHRDLFHCKSRTMQRHRLAVKIGSSHMHMYVPGFHALAVQCFCCFGHHMIVKVLSLHQNLRWSHKGTGASHMLLRCLFIKPQKNAR